MPGVFDKYDVRFNYPDNWELEEQNLEGGIAISVTSPGGAFWTVTIYPRDISVEQATQAVLEGVRGAYPDVEVFEADEIIAGESLLGYEVNFICLDLTNTAQIRGFQRGAATFTILWQAEDSDYRRLQEVFHAVTISLLTAGV
jgi:hypothetical protein